jgi:hypothetical protein
MKKPPWRKGGMPLEVRVPIWTSRGYFIVAQS